MAEKTRKREQWNGPPTGICWRCGFEQTYPHFLHIEADGCYTGSLGDILRALEAPIDRNHRKHVAWMIREATGMCMETGCWMPRYFDGHTAYCLRHEAEHEPAPTEREGT